MGGGGRFVVQDVGWGKLPGCEVLLSVLAGDLRESSNKNDAIATPCFDGQWTRRRAKNDTEPRRVNGLRGEG